MLQAALSLHQRRLSLMCFATQTIEREVTRNAARNDTDVGIVVWVTIDSIAQISR